MKLADESLEREQIGRRGAQEPRRRAHRRSRVPDVVGQPAVAAINQLRAKGLNPAVEHQPTDAPDQHGVVLAQEPSSEVEVPRGATLAVWVGVPNATVDAALPAEHAPADRVHVEGVGLEQPTDNADAAEAVADRLDDGSAMLDDGWYAPATVSTEPLPHAAVPESAEEEAAAARLSRRRVLGIGAALAVVAAVLLAGPMLHDDRDHARPDTGAATPAAERAARRARSSSATSISPSTPSVVSARRLRRAVTAGPAARISKRARSTLLDARHRRRRPTHERPTHPPSDAPAAVAAQPPTAPASGESSSASQHGASSAPAPPTTTAPPAASSHVDSSEPAAAPAPAARAAQQEFFTP